MEMLNQALLVGHIKAVFKEGTYTTDFVISVKRKDDDKWDDILCRVNNKNKNGWCRDKNNVSVAGVLRTDSWAVDAEGNALKEKDIKKVNNKFKDDTGKYYDKRIHGWQSKTYLMVISAKSLETETTSVFDKLVMDGITASSGSAFMVD